MPKLIYRKSIDFIILKSMGWHLFLTRMEWNNKNKQRTKQKTKKQKNKKTKTKTKEIIEEILINLTHTMRMERQSMFRGI